MFRISFGDASCKKYTGSEKSLLDVCNLVLEKIQYLKNLRIEQLEKWSNIETTEIEVNGKIATLTVFKDTVSQEKALIIVQAFYPTWRYPNYLSFGGVGRIFAEGFYIDTKNEISDAKDSELWPYR